MLVFALLENNAFLKKKGPEQDMFGSSSPNGVKMVFALLEKAVTVHL